jgi:hypothetical protein
MRASAVRFARPQNWNTPNVRENFALGVISWLLIGLAAIAVGVLGILHVIFHNAFPGALLVVGGAVAAATAVLAALRGRPPNYPKVR